MPRPSTSRRIASGPRRSLLPALVLTAACTCAPSAEAVEEAQLYCITNWSSDCSGSTLQYWDDLGDAWYDDINDALTRWLHLGDIDLYYSQDRREVNTSIADSWFIDRDAKSWGLDACYLDEGDAALVCLHGSEKYGRWRGKVKIDESGDGNCYAWQGSMELGDRDLEFLHISSSNSMDDNQWDDWWESFDGLHQVHGFHGNMYVKEKYESDYQGFSYASFYLPMAEHWVDSHYHNWASWFDDQCPVSYAVGTSESNVEARMDNEHYDIRYSDPSSITHWGAIYIEGCNPDDEGKLD